MNKIEIYTKSYCPYCDKAKLLLNKKGLKYEEIDVENDEPLRQKMIQRAGGRMTVPQIFINDTHVGGCDDLYAKDAKGDIDKLLN